MLSRSYQLSRKLSALEELSAQLGQLSANSTAISYELERPATSTSNQYQQPVPATSTSNQYQQPVPATIRQEPADMGELSHGKGGIRTLDTGFARITV
jgi:hypothetical protein